MNDITVYTGVTNLCMTKRSIALQDFYIQSYKPILGGGNRKCDMNLSNSLDTSDSSMEWD